MKGVLLTVAFSGLFLLGFCEFDVIFKNLKFEIIGEPILNAEVKSQKYNRTNYFINGKLHLMKAFGERIKLTTYVYYMKGSVKLSQIEIYKEKPSCEIIESDVFVWPEFFRSIGIPKSCPFEPKEYEIKNYKVDINGLPEDLPDGLYEIETHFILDDEIQQKCFISVQIIKQ